MSNQAHEVTCYSSYGVGVINEPQPLVVMRPGEFLTEDLRPDAERLGMSIQNYFEYVLEFGWPGSAAYNPLDAKDRNP